MTTVQQDSILQEPVGMTGDTTTAAHHTVLTPAMVLRWLPRSATPAQQDSAIQAHFKPSEIRWSTRPDTLHLPGHDKGHNLLDVQLPQYYREGFFSKDTLFHPELPGGRYGTAGDPVPYSVHGDDVLTLLLLSCFIVVVVSFSNVSGFFARQAKHFFYVQHATTEITETGNEVRFQIFLTFLAGLLLSLLFYFFTLHYIGETFVLKSQYHLIVIYMGLIVGYMLLKTLVQTLANLIFFGGKKSIQWIKSMLFLTSVEGIALFPIVMLRAYFDLSMQNVVIYFIIVLLIVKILTFYKAFVIFFRLNVVSLQIILYFCALEMVPLLALWGTLVFTANNLKINF